MSEQQPARYEARRIHGAQHGTHGVYDTVTHSYVHVLGKSGMAQGYAEGMAAELNGRHPAPAPLADAAIDADRLASQLGNALEAARGIRDRAQAAQARGARDDDLTYVVRQERLLASALSLAGIIHADVEREVTAATGGAGAPGSGDLVVTVRLSDESGGIRSEDVRAAVEKAVTSPETGLLGMNARVTAVREGGSA
jgi:hypothetical protein